MKCVLKMLKLKREGAIKDGDPIPNNLFTFRELRLMYQWGMIREHNGRFIVNLDMV